MHITINDFGLMTITFTTTDGETATTKTAYGFHSAMDKLNELRELFDIESAMFVCAITGEIVAEITRV